MLVVGWACGACLEFDLWALNSTLKCFTFLYCLSYLWRDFWVQSHCTAPGVTRNLKTWASWPEALGVTPLFRGLVYFQTGPWVVCLPVIWVLRTPLWAQWLTCVCVCVASPWAASHLPLCYCTQQCLPRSATSWHFLFLCRSEHGLWSFPFEISLLYSGKVCTPKCYCVPCSCWYLSAYFLHKVWGPLDLPGQIASDLTASFLIKHMATQCS